MTIEPSTFLRCSTDRLIALNTVDDPDKLALKMLAWGQGAAAMANAYKDKKYMQEEVQIMCDWLNELPLKEH
ncbi:MAG: hypothetical protein ACPGR2_17625 [Psychrobium sp.]